MIILAYEEHLLKFTESKVTERFDLYSKYHINDRIKGKIKNTILSQGSLLTNKTHYSYLLSSLVVNKVSGEYSCYGDCSPQINMINDESYKVTKNILKETISINSVFTKQLMIERSIKSSSIKDRNLNYETEEKFKLTRVIKQQIKTLKELEASGKNLSFLDNKDYKVINLEKLKTICTLVLPNIKEAVVDVETNGLKFYNLPDNSMNSTLTGIVLAWEKDSAVYIPIRHENTDNVPEEIAIELLRPFLESINWVVHNAFMEVKVFWSLGIRLNLYFDTLLGAFALNPIVVKKSKALKTLTHDILGMDTIELSELMGSGNEDKFHLVEDPKLMAAYACPDGDSPIYLKEYILANLPRDQHKLLFSDIDACFYLALTEYYGVVINRELFEKFNDINNKDINFIKNVIYKYVGQTYHFNQVKTQLEIDEMTEEKVDKELSELVSTEQFKNLKHEFDLSKDSQISNVMFNMLGYPVLVRQVKTGLPALNKISFAKLSTSNKKTKSNWLKKDIISYSFDEGLASEKEAVILAKEDFNRADFPLVLLIKTYRQLVYLKTNIFDSFLNKLHEARLHPYWMMHGSLTARVLSNIQTLKKPMKRFIISPKDFTMAVTDASQIEYRYLYGETGNEVVVKSLLNCESDLHRINASIMYKMLVEDVTSVLRGNAKAVGFGSVYGKTEYGLAEDLKISLEEAIVVKSAWNNVNFREVEFLNSYKKMVRVVQPSRKGYGCVRNKFGRRRWFDLNKINAKAERETINYPIQSGARELFINAYRRLNKRIEKDGLLGKIFIVALVHDEFVIYYHNSISYKYIYKLICEECMYNTKYSLSPKVMSSMFEDKEHPPYYWGISICDDWYEGKIDLYEAPINFVYEELENGEEGYTGENQKEYVMNRMKNYIQRRMYDYLKELQPDISIDNVNYELIESKFKNYFLKPKLKDFYGTKNIHEAVDLILAKQFNKDIVIKDTKVFASDDKDLQDNYIIEETIEEFEDMNAFNQEEYYETEKEVFTAPIVTRDIKEGETLYDILDVSVRPRLASHFERRVLNKDGILLFNCKGMSNERVLELFNKLEEGDDFKMYFIMNDGSIKRLKKKIKDFKEIRVGYITFFRE